MLKSVLASDELVFPQRQEEDRGGGMTTLFQGIGRVGYQVDLILGEDGQK